MSNPESPSNGKTAKPELPSLNKTPEELQLDQNFATWKTYEEYCKENNKEPTLQNWAEEKKGNFVIRASVVPPRFINPDKNKDVVLPNFDNLRQKITKTDTGETKKNRKGEEVHVIKEDRSDLSDEERVNRKKRWFELTNKKIEIAKRNAENWKTVQEKIASGELPKNFKFVVEKMEKNENKELIAMNSTIGWDDKSWPKEKKQKKTKGETVKDLVEDVSSTAKKLKLEVQKIKGSFCAGEKTMVWEMSIREVE